MKINNNCDIFLLLQSVIHRKVDLTEAWQNQNHAVLQLVDQTTR